MRDSTEPYCFSMLEPRVMRGGTMRPENSSKVWPNTFCEWSRLSTLWSSVTPASPALMACCEMPLAAASVLKSVSQASKLPGAAGDGGERGRRGSIDAASAEGCESEARRSSGSFDANGFRFEMS